MAYLIKMNIRPSILALSLGAISSFVQSTAFADDPIILDVITLEAQADKPTASLGKLGQTNKEVAHALTVVSEDDMKNRNLQSLDDVLQAAGGITSQPFQLLTTGYYTRGFKIDSFSQNGVPVLMGNMAAAPQEMSIYEQVEVLRGANGLLQGTGNPAATVNLVPKRPKDHFTGTASLGYGSWNNINAGVDLSVPLTQDGRLRSRVVASAYDKDYFYDHSKQRSENYYGVLDFDLTEQATIYLGAHDQKIRGGTNMAGVPFYANGQDMHLSRSTYLDTSWDRFDWNNTRVFTGLDYKFDNGWFANVQYNHFQGKSYLDYAGASGKVDPITGKGLKLTGGSYQFDNQQDSVDAYAKGHIQLFDRQHELLVGAQYQKITTEQYTASVFGLDKNIEVDPWHWDPSSVARPIMDQYISRGPDVTEQTGYYATGRFSVTDQLKFILGGRLSHWKNTASNKTIELNNEFTPYTGLIWTFNPTWNGYVSYSQIFQPQKQKDADGNLIDPIRGNNFEAGVKADLLDGRLNLNAAVYQIIQEDRAQEDPAHPCASQLDNHCYIADGKVRSRGFEFEAKGQIRSDLSMTASYSNNHSKYLRDAKSEGQSFSSFAPKHMFNLWLNYTPTVVSEKLDLGLGLRAQSDYSVTSGGVTLHQSGYSVMDTKVGYHISPNLEASIFVKNLFDRRYYQSLSGVNWNNRYGEPRSAMLMLHAKF